MYIQLRPEEQQFYLKITFRIFNIKYENALASAGVFLHLCLSLRESASLAPSGRELSTESTEGACVQFCDVSVTLWHKPVGVGALDNPKKSNPL